MNRALKWLHTALDFGGFFFDGFDFVNVLLYHFEGRDTEAAITLLCLIPGMGNFLALPVRLTLKLGDNAGEALIKLGKKYLPDLMENGSRFLDWAGGKIDDVWRWIQKKLGKAGADEIILKTQKNVGMPILPEGSQWERNVLNSFSGGKASPVTYEGGVTLYRVGGKNGGFWSLDPPPATEYQWRVDFAIRQEFCNDASTLYKITIPEGSTLSGLEGTIGSQGMGLYGGAHQVYIDYREVPLDWIEITPMKWK